VLVQKLGLVTCKDVKDATLCKEHAFQDGYGDPNCSSCGSSYFFWTSNSNFWVSSTLRAFGMTPPIFLNAPGYNFDPDVWIKLSQAPQF